jgi:tRNA dimethylallyltransferase
VSSSDSNFNKSVSPLGARGLLITIIGPTAIGKTSLSIALAQHFNCEIISCDSRQFFKEMAIGTAVPSKEELEAVPHHFIQNKSIFETYTVGDFEKEALATLDALFLKNNIQIMVGGSGLYVDAVLNGLDSFPEIRPEIRSQVREKYETNGIEFLQQRLQFSDSEYYNYLLQNNPQTLKNPQRMMRFVEVCESSGNPYSFYINKEKKERNFTPILLGLEADRSVMYDRINQRVDVMFEEGLENEAKKLFQNKNLNALQTVGYKEVFEYFEEKITINQAKEKIKMNTRRFAKRQLTWFKRTENVTWFDYQTNVASVVSHINKFL